MDAQYAGIERRSKKHSFENSEQFIVVKSWHVVITVLSIIILSTLWFGSLRDETTANTKQIQEIKQQNLTRDLYEVGQKATEKRLERIEQKLDAQDVRNWTIDSTVRAKTKKD